jgi:hypothetical protein
MMPHNLAPNSDWPCNGDGARYVAASTDCLRVACPTSARALARAA